VPPCQGGRRGFKSRLPLRQYLSDSRRFRSLRRYRSGGFFVSISTWIPHFVRPAAARSRGGRQPGQAGADFVAADGAVVLHGGGGGVCLAGTASQHLRRQSERQVGSVGIALVPEARGHPRLGFASQSNPALNGNCGVLWNGVEADPRVWRLLVDQVHELFEQEKHGRNRSNAGPDEYAVERLLFER
jgi:hypothetical protein